MKEFFIPIKEFQLLTKKVDELTTLIQKKLKSPNADLSEKWLSITEVCKILRISSRTCYKYRMDGTLPYSQFQNKIYIRKIDVESHFKKYFKSDLGIRKENPDD